MEWQGTEEETEQQLEAGCGRVHMEFRCDQILVSSATSSCSHRLERGWAAVLWACRT